MRPAARVQTAIEMLDGIIAAAKAGGAPAERVIAEGFRQRRYAGSKDRRAIRELVYAAIRACGPVPQSGRAAMLRLAEDDSTIAELFDGSDYGPPAIAPDEPRADGGIAPDWLVERLASSGVTDGEAHALLGRASLDLRVNTLKAERASIALPVDVEPIAAPHGLRVPTGSPVEQWDAFKSGLVEVQDGGSQIACMAVGAQPGETIIDLCAGAGGKTLALAAAMSGEGRLVACDVDRSRLGKLAPRSERAGANRIETRLLDGGKEREGLSDLVGTADAVLVDAPCSGTGTWRRQPEARWRLTPDRLQSYVNTQRHLLDLAKELVAPGGRLVFVTCSLLDEEGTDQIDAFLADNRDWNANELALPAGRERGKGTRLTPFHDGTDGFFIAQLLRGC